MGEQHIILEGDITAVDTATQLTGFFGSAGETQIPEGVSRIKEIKTGARASTTLRMISALAVSAVSWSPATTSTAR
jgi:hypothetical protein